MIDCLRISIAACAGDLEIKKKYGINRDRKRRAVSHASKNREPPVSIFPGGERQGQVETR